MPRKKPSSTANEQISVAEATRQIVDTHPSILDCLREEVVNFSALAENLYGEVTRVTSRERVNKDSIKMALMRYCDQLQQQKDVLERSVMQIIADSVLELKNDLMVVTVQQEAVLARGQELFTFMQNFRFFQLIQGTTTFTLLADQAHKRELDSFFRPTSVVGSWENQSALILISPPEIIQTMGIVAYLSHLFSTGGVNLTQIMSCHTDTIFIVDREQALEAYTILEEKIFFLRKLLHA